MNFRTGYLRSKSVTSAFNLGLNSAEPTRMGAIVSSFASKPTPAKEVVPAPAAAPSPPKELTADMKLEVAQTWKLVAEDLEGHGIVFFKRIFELAPEALQLFSFKDEPNLYESPALKQHANKVMTTVGVAVAGLADVEKLIPVLKGLGQRHKGRGVLPAHYDVVGAALLYALEQGLGGLWTDTVKDAWSTVYGIVSSTMIAGAEY